MTREEAIECIEAIHVQMFNSGNSKWTEACDMAIEALKREQKALELKPLVRNISGWNEMVNEISKLSECKGNGGDEK